MRENICDDIISFIRELYGNREMPVALHEPGLRKKKGVMSAV